MLRTLGPQHLYNSCFCACLFKLCWKMERQQQYNAAKSICLEVKPCSESADPFSALPVY
jgi:hypothetical protein